MRLRSKIIGVALCFLLVCAYQLVALSLYSANFHPGAGAAHRPELDAKTEQGAEMGKPFSVPLSRIYKATHHFTGDDNLPAYYSMWAILIPAWFLLSLAYAMGIFLIITGVLWLVRPLIRPERDEGDSWD